MITIKTKHLENKLKCWETYIKKTTNFCPAECNDLDIMLLDGKTDVWDVTNVIYLHVFIFINLMQYH